MPTEPRNWDITIRASNGKRANGGNGTAAPATGTTGRRRTSGDAPLINEASGTVRLAPGALRDQVADYMADHRGQESCHP